MISPKINVTFKLDGALEGQSLKNPKGQELARVFPIKAGKDLQSRYVIYAREINGQWFRLGKKSSHMKAIKLAECWIKKIWFVHLSTSEEMFLIPTL